MQLRCQADGNDPSLVASACHTQSSNVYHVSFTVVLVRFSLTAHVNPLRRRPESLPVGSATCTIRQYLASAASHLLSTKTRMRLHGSAGRAWNRAFLAVPAHSIPGERAPKSACSCHLWSHKRRVGCGWEVFVGFSTVEHELFKFCRICPERLERAARLPQIKIRSLVGAARGH
jgi:hypothetical protein